MGEKKEKQQTGQRQGECLIATRLFLFIINNPVSPCRRSHTNNLHSLQSSLSISINETSLSRSELASGKSGPGGEEVCEGAEWSERRGASGWRVEDGGLRGGGDLERGVFYSSSFSSPCVMT